VDVGREGLGPRLVRVVGEDKSRVLEKSREVCRLASGGGSHIKDPLPRLRSERNDGKERRGRLKHVVTSEVLRGGTDGDSRLEHLEADLGPLADRLEVDTAVDERLGEIAAARTERVGPDGNGTRGLVGVEE
jgi:hypothetical protein